MKKSIICLLIFVLTFLFTEYAHAAVWECEYSYNNNELVMEIDNVNGTMKNKKEKKNNIFNQLLAKVTYNYEYVYESDEMKKYKSKEDGEDKNQCPIIYVVEKISTENSDVNNPDSDLMTHYYYTYYTDSYLRENRNECVEKRDNICLSSLLVGVNTYYYTAILTNSEANSENVEVSNCPAFVSSKEKITKLYQDYSNCKVGNCYSYISEANQEIDIIKDYCKQALKYRDVYIESSNGESIQDACISVCLNIEDEIKTLKANYGIDNGTDDGECGLSNVILKWILNIIKWVKYIIPVIVILMGILDFIRAVATDKDDGMKKAQGRFVKRLIAAALIFVVPFILEFILEKMGFSVEGCRVINFD